VRIPERTLGSLLIAAGLIWLGWGSWQNGWQTPDKNDSNSARRLQSKPILPETETASTPIKRLSCRVLRVYDGDTLACDINRNGHVDKPEEEIRLLGIDSPEMHYSRKNSTFGSAHPQDEPFAAESSQWLTEHADGRVLFLEFDKREYDRYGRHLAYVYADNLSQQSVNEEALHSGYATTLFIGRNRRYQDRFEKAENEARQANRGLWKKKR
jgi:micrococcal nuclease